MQRIFKLSLVAVACLLVNLAVARAEEQSVVVKLEDVPADAQKTILHESGEGKGKLCDIEKVTEDGETRYDVELKKGKVERSFSVAPDGKLLSMQVFIHELPEAARKAIRKQTEKAKLGEIDRVTDEDKTTYEVTMTRDGRELSFSVAPSGKLLTLQVELAETPDKVQAAIKQRAGDAVIKSIEKNTEDEDGDVTYDVEATKDGKKLSFSVDAEGKAVED